MSTLKVNTIQDTTGNDALTIDSSGNVTASQGFVPSTQLSHRNLIINGDFQVSQRGDYTSATSASNATYYLDRWIVAQNVSATIQDIGRKIKMVCTSGGTGTMKTYQKIELDTINKFLGQKVTLSAKVKSNSSDCRLLGYMDAYQTETAVHSGGGTEETLSVTFTVPSSSLSTAAAFHIGIDGEASANVTVNTNDYFEVTEVQLEVGSVATPFEHRSYGEELAKCQRYYIRYFSSSVDSGDTVCQAATGAGTTNVRLCWNFPVTLRAQPTITQVGTGWHLKKPGAAAVSSTSTATTASNWFYGDKIVMQVAGWSGLGDNYCYNVAPQSLTELSFDSEL